MEPNKDHIRKWVNDLRSGDYAQATMQLHVPEDGFCCLGVACETYRHAEKQGVWREVRERMYFFPGGNKIETHDYLPPTISKWLGLNKNPLLMVTEEEIEEFEFDNLTEAGGKNYMAVGELNDEHGWDFDMIANAVERTYLA